MRMVNSLFQRRDELRTVYTYWQPPQSMQRLRADRQMSEPNTAFACALARDSPAVHRPPIECFDRDFSNQAIRRQRREAEKYGPRGPVPSREAHAAFPPGRALSYSRACWNARLLQRDLPLWPGDRSRQIDL
jgi:hypothetical protein